MRTDNVVTVLATVLFLTLGSMTAEGADSYIELYRLAKRNDSIIVQAEARLAASKAESRITVANLYPRVDANVGVNQIGQTILNYGPTTQTGSVLGYNYGVSARINLLHMPTLMNLAAADAGVRREEASVRMARQDLIVRFADAYFGLLRAQEDHDIARKELERVKQMLEQSQAFFQTGAGDIIAVYEVRARYDSVTADLNRFESNLKLAEQKLSALVGKTVSDVQKYQPLVAMPPQPENLPHWIAVMEQNDPMIRQGVEGLERTTQELKAVKAEHYPTVQATGGYTSSKGSVFLPEVETQQWYVGMNISIPIYSGGETTARVQRAVAQETERRGFLDDLRKQRSDNLKQAYYNVLYSIALIKSLEQRVTSAELQLTAVTKGRSIGTRSAIDVLNAQQSYYIALRDHRNALYDNAFKNILLKNAAGILDDDNQVPMLQGKETPAVASQPKAEAVVREAKPLTIGAGVGVVTAGAATFEAQVFYGDYSQKVRRQTPCAPKKLPVETTRGDQVFVVVLDKQNTKLKVACSSGDDTAWVDLQKEWRYNTWKEFFSGRKVRVSPGLPKELYNVYDATEKEIMATLQPNGLIEVASIIENWALLKIGNGQTGWWRWKDARGTLLISAVQ